MPKTTITRAVKTGKKKDKTKPRHFIDEEIIKSMFSRKIIRHIARKTGFIRRQRKLRADNFFSMVFGTTPEDAVSLTALTEHLSTPMTRSGMNKRFDKYACDFLQAVYARVFTLISKIRNRSLSDAIFKKFNHIQINDSSSWKIPAALKETFPGYNQAGCKMQFMLDYKTGTTTHIHIGHETDTDQRYAKNIAGLLQNNDLSLFDLGFAIPEVLHQIDDKGAFFLCRFNATGMKVYKDAHRISPATDILTWLDPLKDQKAVYEIPCFIGNQNLRTKARLLAIRAPEEVANRRRQKLIAQDRKKGWTPKERSLKLCDWTILITNVPVQKGLSVQEIFALYAIRWTIEIFFKQLKSVLHIHKTLVKSNPYRLKAEILARSIVAVFMSYCFSLARTALWNNDRREISFEKTVKYFRRHLFILTDKFLHSLRRATVYLQQMIPKIILTCEKFRQPTRKNSLDQLLEQTLFGTFKHVKLARPQLVGFSP